MQPNLTTSSNQSLKPAKAIGLALLFFVVAAAGLYYVKWSPYYEKAFIAATKHDIGKSILSGGANAAPEPSIQTAWEYAKTYFLAVWKAAVLGIVLGSLVQVLIPRDWLIRALGSRSFRSTAIAGVASLPGMMCSCCAAPVAVGLRKRFASVGAALAFWLGNPVLNPATIIFMGFVLSWKFAVLRIVFGLLLVFGVAYFANRFVKEEEVQAETLELPEQTAVTAQSGSLAVRWGKSLWSLFWSVTPVYLITVLLLGAARAWLFPAVNPDWGNSLWAIVFLAITGTLFVIPTAAEIPIAKTMMSYGLGAGPAAALMMTLPAISLPSLIMVRKVFPAKVLWFVTGMVIAFGIVTGLAAILI
ncbi:permease [Effusibacillus pohliae]|uniref:permease n=1 Tax=Effusibacillus pohliae TaxID=232270 RepID=UPI000372A5FB|nr:permease [Effusibacillus pohliae]